ncbi:MAG: lipoprotein-releasing ABC transporter permease subunit [candidate division KSB1 bacterium]|nr:lipoprotein-releasing ABC transporter permease subunit [candidate division KSB1 bacterium]MDZ7272608.1 lipoprotein-releasing ABC transporter permease subunit [candidate division KSB1 bacterium]MDZ7284369.1 lipoprotein-releasing ABC transporter permease subunit [candidate division KSB1 bacterium]MDZ7297235.1 lipoprotein-releasing ABC transporter permease subunit [candidate division KSB1 bacterium]MDZ7308302.1 lipoprotein-releasing ABC transporter permease subunit [candidate division KSB1 bact
MFYELFIARRYLRSKRQVKFISLITYISIAGVAIGTAALVIVLSVMNGFESEVRSRIIGFDAHIKVKTFHDQGLSDYRAVEEKIKDLPHIVAASPYVFNKALILAQGQDRKEGIIIKGIDPKRESLVTDLVKNVNYGTLDLGLIDKEGERPLPGILLGYSLADRLEVGPGDKVTLLSAAGLNVSGFGAMPRALQFRVAGYFETGIFEYDSNCAFIGIPEAQKLFELGNKVTGLQLKLEDMDLADEVAGLIESRLKYPYNTETWFEVNKNLFSWMQFEKWIAFIILSLIIIVAAFNIVSSLIMVVLEKTREIGILKSMGATNQSVMRIFMLQGLVAGVIGTATGLTLGYLLCWSQLKWKFFSLPADVYIINALPILMRPLDFAAVGLAAIVLSFTATIYPALRAATLDPVQAIRYE